MWTELLLAVALAAPIVEPTPAGDTLVVVPDARVELVSLHLALPVGHLSPWWWSGEVAAAWHLPLTDPVLAGRLSALMDFQLDSDDWSTTLAATFRTADLDRSLAAVQDFIDSDMAPRDAIRSWRVAGRGPWDEPQSTLQVMVRRLLLDPRDLRRQPPPTPPRRRARLQRTRADLLRTTGRIIGLTGDISTAKARAFAAELLPPPAPTPPRGHAPDPVDIPPLQGGLQSGWLPGSGHGAIVLTRASLSRTDPAHPALLVALHALAEGVRARLLIGLRHEAGLIYSLSVSDGLGAIPSLLTIAIPARASQLSQTSQLAERILSTFAAEGITEAEHQAAARALAHQAVPQTPQQELLQSMEAIRHGWPLDHHQQTAIAARSLSTKQINDFIGAFFDPESIVMLRFWPAPRLTSTEI